jgi:hypothetical protein
VGKCGFAVRDEEIATKLVKYWGEVCEWRLH